MPRRVFTSGRKFSTTTSALAASRRKVAAPSGDLRSSVMPRLLRCRFWKSGPWRAPPQVFADIQVLGQLDLDDIGAPIGQLANGSGTGADTRHVEDSEARKGA